MTASPTWRFAIAGDACPQLALRVLGLFAQQNLTPAEVTIRCDADALAMAIVQPALNRHRACLIAEKMRAMIMIREVVEEPV